MPVPRQKTKAIKKYLHNNDMMINECHELNFLYLPPPSNPLL